MLILEDQLNTELSDNVWEEPGLLSECPKCKEKLKFNPFLVGADEFIKQKDKVEKY